MDVRKYAAELRADWHFLADVGCGSAVIRAAFHLVSIPVTNTSVNPARSTARALFVGGWALEQLWQFWAAPLIGGIIAGRRRCGEVERHKVRRNRYTGHPRFET